MPKLLDLKTGAIVDGAAEADLVLAHDHDMLREPLSVEGVLIVRLELPKFKDGRAFTQARLLRQRYGFAGEIRVGGHVLPDQAMHLARTGVDRVELDDDARVEDFRAALSAYRYAYQRAVRGEPAFALRDSQS